METTKRTQCDAVLDYIKAYGSITALQAITDLGCMRLASRISDLRRRGIKIKSRKVTVAKRMGGFTSIAEYSLEKV
jgi:hypothetical protein